MINNRHISALQSELGVGCDSVAAHAYRVQIHQGGLTSQTNRNPKASGTRSRISVVPTVRQLNQADCSEFKINPGYTLTQVKGNWNELEPSGRMGDLSLSTEGKTVPRELRF